MFKIILYSFLLIGVLAQLRFQNKERGKCVVADNLTLSDGDRVSDPNGLCQEYNCDDTGYVINFCGYYHDCILEKGNPAALFPECCDHPKPNAKHGPHCHGVA